jgi:hypothetical protein
MTLPGDEKNQGEFPVSYFKFLEGIFSGNWKV